MSHLRIIVLTTLAMIAFAGNSLLCRMALKQTEIDAASFTSIRLISGALVLWMIVRLNSGTKPGSGSWLSAFALFIYAAGFSFAYVSLPTGTGALLLFGSVQLTMIGYGIWKGERLIIIQFVGFMIAFLGMVLLLLPGISAPPLTGSIFMLGSGVSWGIYSLRGRGAGNPTRITAGNFLRAIPFTLVLSFLMMQGSMLDISGLGYAVASGTLASGIGYAIWYTVLPALSAIKAATIQLSVPVIAAIGGVIFLGEAISLRLALSSIAVLGGISFVILRKSKEGRRSITGHST